MIDSLFDAKLTQRQALATSLITAAVRRRRLANAYLLTGPALDDKWILARQLACFLNCSHLEPELKLERGSCHIVFHGTEAISGREKAEQQYCQNCRWISQDQHPQAWLPLGANSTKSGKIPVEKARALSAELSKSSRFVRMAIVEDAAEESFHRPAANALLKTIEDAGDGIIFVLFAARAEDVLPTVVSRCQVVPMRGLDESLISLMHKQQPVSDEARKALPAATRAAESQANIQALDFGYALQTLVNSELSAQTAIESAVALELERLGQTCVTDSHTAAYIKNLIVLSENAKEQIDHYVSQKAVLESFSLAWRQLRSGARI